MKKAIISFLAICLFALCGCATNVVESTIMTLETKVNMNETTSEKKSVFITEMTTTETTIKPTSIESSAVVTKESSAASRLKTTIAETSIEPAIIESSTVMTKESSDASSSKTTIAETTIKQINIILTEEYPISTVLEEITVETTIRSTIEIDLTFRNSLLTRISALENAMNDFWWDLEIQKEKLNQAGWTAERLIPQYDMLVFDRVILDQVKTDVIESEDNLAFYDLEMFIIELEGKYL